MRLLSFSVQLRNNLFQACSYIPLIILLLVTLVSARDVVGEDSLILHQFKTQPLTDTYFSEGIGVGDINGDKINDIVYGPHWYAGPDFTKANEIYSPVPQNKEGYADNFFNWVYDFDGDGANDVLVVGFPGTPAFVHQNPGRSKRAWIKQQVFDWVSNESPHFTQLVGDATPELVCSRDGFFGFATFDPKSPWEPWKFHAVSQQVTDKRFGHGLGVGDVNGDGRLDIVHSKGWLEQPATAPLETRWKPHDASFSSAYGGAEMHVYDVDGDGLNDVITSEAAHDFGLSWYRQTRDGETVSFTRNSIMGSHPSENPYGVLFTELHSLQLADIDGDGLKDIVTGKTYYSHHRQSPMWDAGAVVYWFALKRDKDGVKFLPYKAAADTGVGRQLVVQDINGDGHLDMAVGGMKGAHVLIHEDHKVDAVAWKEAQPKPYVGKKLPAPTAAVALRGPKADLGRTTGRVANAMEGEKIGKKASAGTAESQAMGGFPNDTWSGDSHLWWTGAKPGDVLEMELPGREKIRALQLVLTCARDYGIVQLALDDQPLGKPIDLFNPEVITTGVLTFEGLKVEEKPTHKLSITIVGANPKAAPAHMVGVDWIRWIAEGDSLDTADEKDDSIVPLAADGRALNLDFETGTLQDWTASGDAFEGQPIEGDMVALRRPDMSSRHRGKFWIGGYEKIKDAGTGTLTSVPFEVTHPYASFLANGGPQSECRVELIRQDTGKVFYQISGTEMENMRAVHVDLRPHQGKMISIRLVDESKNGWGHLNFDHFRFHDTAPKKFTQPVAVLVPDEYPLSKVDAAQAAAAMKLPEGFKVTVAAAEPEVMQPIAMALDDRGRVWIAEAYEYPIRAKGDKGRDRILIFEDENGDGKLDSRKVFAEGLNLVSGLEVGFGGVWVGAAPYLLFIPDRNADDKPDSEPQILLDGWGLQDTHETLNAFIWGPDGWLYGCHGVFTHSKVGKPGTKDEDRTPINAGVWRYHPTKHIFEVFAHGTSNPWGVDFNDYGDAFITACVIPHLYHMIDGGRYIRQAGSHFNPHTYQDINTIADHLHYLGATPHSGNSKSDAAGGGHAHAGAMIYLGGRWPKEYRNGLFMNNIHGQRLNMDTLKPEGSGYVGSHGPDFLLTGDNASQILNLRYGPDGNAWMIDWYDMQACHRVEVNVHDRSNGRIYKIIYGDSEKGTDLSKLTDTELAKHALNPNDWYVRHSRRILQERFSTGKLMPESRGILMEIARTHQDETRVLRALWGLHVTGGVDADLTGEMLKHASPYVRSWAIRLKMEDASAGKDADWPSQLAKVGASDNSPVVRLAIASATQRLPLEARWNILQSLCSHAEDANDHNLPLMYWYAAEPLADLEPTRALALGLAAGEHIPLLRDFMLRRIGSSNAEEALVVLVKGLGIAKEDSLRKTFLGAIRAALKGQRKVNAPESWRAVYEQLSQSSDGDVKLQATALGVTFGDPKAMAVMRSSVADTNQSIESRRVALESLLEAKDPELVDTLLDLAVNSPMADIAIRGLASYDSPKSAEVLLSNYAGLPAELKRAALATLCARSASGVQLLKAIESKRVPNTDLTADLVRQLQYHKNEDLEKLLGNVWGTVRQSPEEKLKMIAEYKSLVASTTSPKPDLTAGRAIFAQTCGKCHVLYGVGSQIGPDLTGSNRSDLDYLLSNIVDPSSVMAKEYQPTIILTEDGRVVTGLVKAEDEKTITLQTTDELVVMPKDEIEQRQLSEKSMMPEDQLKQFNQDQVRSLIAYLSAKKQTPMKATTDNTSTLFNGKDLKGWTGAEGLWTVENGEIVGRTEGLAKNEWLVSDLEVSDFRFSLEVLLTKNEGNSGIQFRSEAADGEVSGYQADIGPGWWGKLYEEHGRALLSEKSGEEFIKNGEWTKYEILVQGDHIRTFINGQPCVDLHDPKGRKRGILALQLHSGGKTEVRFRNLKLQVLP
jgi:putative membrane-bound dehydrogenase-like protein